MELVTEYLIIIEKSSSEAFYYLCDKSDEFNKLLQTDSNITIGAGWLKYKKVIELGYEVKSGSVQGKEQRYFHVKLTFKGDEAGINDYTEMLKSVRGTVYRAGAQPETLRDDVSWFFSNKSYPLIHRVENLMRKLITYFMLTNVGKEWVLEASPTSVKEAMDKSKRKQYVDVLHQLDFIHLGDFLFKAYQTRNVVELYDDIEKAQSNVDLNLTLLKEFRPKSNWERYFSKVVSCDDQYLDKRWSLLYELRCLIAHNAIVTRNDYERIVELVDEVTEHLQKAIDNLDKVHVPTEDRDQVAETVASNINALYGTFIQLWKYLETMLNRARDTASSTRLKSVGILLQELYASGVIDDEQLSAGIELVHFRNRLLHAGATSIEEHEISSKIASLENFTKTIRLSWKDEIVEALIALGGKASLSQLYAQIENHTHRTLADTWQATIRYTLQIHSSDTDSYRGGEDLFQRLDKGYWGLRNFHDHKSRMDQTS
jgi:Apea-like HEPN